MIQKKYDDLDEIKKKIDNSFTKIFELLSDIQNEKISINNYKNEMNNDFDIKLVKTSMNNMNIHLKLLSKNLYSI